MLLANGMVYGDTLDLKTYSGSKETKIKYIETWFRKFLQQLTILCCLSHEFIHLQDLEIEIMPQSSLLLTFFC